MATSKENFKTEKCKVLFYDKNLKALDIDFKGYGIRINDIMKCDSDYVSIRYKGEIGTSNFTYKIV